MRKGIVASVAVICSGCCLFQGPPTPVFLPIPDGYLEKCDVPPLPDDNGDLSEAFVAAVQCAQIGNDDKDRIRELLSDE